jgi:NADH dehydrogenase (ubiquinone) Fe-S protein 8
VLFHLELLDVS